MPNDGDRIRGREIGKKGKCNYTWTPCPICHVSRWVQSHQKDRLTQLCHLCSRRGIMARSWKGGRCITKMGYIEVRLFENDFFYSMVNSKHMVVEHRLVMAKHLGRCLHTWEFVHHKNGVKSDNNIDNLELMETKIKRLERRVLQLEAQNILLQKQLESVSVI
jgi:hypothetical protein